MQWLLFIGLVYMFSCVFTEKYADERKKLEDDLRKKDDFYKRKLELLENECRVLRQIAGKR